VERVRQLIIVAILALTAPACAQPLHTSPLHLARESPFVAVTVHDCYDGDTCTVTLHDQFLPSVFRDHIHVRLAGIDAPERHGACALERARAAEARSYLQSILSRAVRIDLVDPQRDKYFRLLAHLIADGQDLSQSLLNAHLAVAYNGGTKTAQWC
jgi:micrococcal nuclease